MRKSLFNFNNKRRVFRVLLSHLTAMLALLVLICFVIDRFNTAMEFMTSELSKWYIAVLAVLALISSILNIVALWVNPDKMKKNRTPDNL